MSSNRKAKVRLIELFGTVDFIDQLHIEIPEAKTYKSKGQMKRMKQLTYHHIKERRFGGKSTVDNGALLTEEHHEWFHQQPKEIREQLNSAFQELKRRRYEQLAVSIEDIDIPIELNICEIAINNIGEIQTYNRAKVKAETRRMIEELE